MHTKQIDLRQIERAKTQSSRHIKDSGYCKFSCILSTAVFGMEKVLHEYNLPVLSALVIFTYFPPLLKMD